MPRQRVAADLGAVLGRALDVDAAARAQPAQRGQRQALLHDVEIGLVGRGQRRDREAGAVDGDAGADGQARGRSPRETAAVKVRSPGRSMAWTTVARPCTMPVNMVSTGWWMRPA
jgi:hypothetical protein